MRLITVFLILLLSSINSFSQDYDKVTFEGQEYNVLPKEFEPHKTGMVDEYPNYINKYGLPDGQWIMFLPSMPDKPYVIGQYKNGLAVGTWKFYSINWDDTTSYVFLTNEYAEGKKNGTQYYYGGFLIQKYEYKDDMYHGEFITFNEQGINLVKGQYQFGIPVGKWEYHNHDGALMRYESYKENIPEDSVEYYSDANRYKQPETRMTNLSDMLIEIEYIPSAEGLWTEYYRSGRIQFEKTYEDGLMKHVKEFYEDGQLKSEGGTIAAVDYSNYPIKASYDPDMPEPFIKHGIWYYYDEKGNKINTEYYKRGKSYDKASYELPGMDLPNE